MIEIGTIHWWSCLIILLAALTGCTGNVTTPESSRSGTVTVATSPRRDGRIHVYDCVRKGEKTVTVSLRLEANRLTLRLPGGFPRRERELERVRSASGARYTGEYAMFWDKGEQAILELSEDGTRSCRLNNQLSPWERADLHGIRFRAIGNEPGWYLEIHDNQGLRFVYDYGQSQYKVPGEAVIRARQTETAVTFIDNVPQQLAVTITYQPCTDTMSGEHFQASVTVRYEDRTYTGCGRDLAGQFTE